MRKCDELVPMQIHELTHLTFGRGLYGLTLGTMHWHLLRSVCPTLKVFFRAFETSEIYLKH